MLDKYIHIFINKGCSNVSCGKMAIIVSSSFKIKFFRHIIYNSLSQALVHCHEEYAFYELKLIKKEYEETWPESHKSFTANVSENDGMFQRNIL